MKCALVVLVLAQSQVCGYDMPGQIRMKVKTLAIEMRNDLHPSAPSISTSYLTKTQSHTCNRISQYQHCYRRMHRLLYRKQTPEARQRLHASDR
jgi:hypothetical protein